jgi:hypothetical protein
MRLRPVLALGAAGALTIAAVFTLVAAAGGTDPGTAILIGSHVWTMKNDRFGGMSAIEVDADGRGFVALSDRGAIVPGTFQRDGEGRITGVKAGPLGVLRGRTEGALPHSRSDSEGLAIAPDGTIYISFEIAPRVLRYRTAFGLAEYLPIPRDFSKMPSNGALETLAVDADGTLYTVPETSIRLDGAFGVYRFRDGSWDQPFSLPGDGGFLPVGGDFGPDGRFYLLERGLGLLGFSTRVRRFVLSGDSVGAGETVLQTEAGSFGNLEGIGVWRDEMGRLRLTLLADNNFKSFLDTQIVEWAIPD